MWGSGEWLQLTSTLQLHLCQVTAPPSYENLRQRYSRLEIVRRHRDGTIQIVNRSDRPN